MTTMVQDVGFALRAVRRDVSLLASAAVIIGLGMVVGRTMMLAGSGVLLGLAGSLALSRLMNSLLFEVEPTDAGTFMAMPAILLSVAVAAGLIPARRASKTDPMVALRVQ